MKKKKIKFYFSFRSPYSWIAYRIINDNNLFNQIDIDYIPFWNPDSISINMILELGGKVIYNEMSEEKLLYLFLDTNRLFKKLNYTFKWPHKAEVWWELSHLSYLIAKKQNKGHLFMDHLYRARWEKALNIGSVEVIEDIFKKIDVTHSDLKNLSENIEIRKEGAQILYKSYMDGVFGVPFFINGIEKFWGIDRISDLIQSLKKTGHIETNEESFTYLFDDHAGGCG